MMHFLLVAGNWYASTAEKLPGLCAGPTMISLNCTWKFSLVFPSTKTPKEAKKEHLFVFFFNACFSCEQLLKNVFFLITAFLHLLTACFCHCRSFHSEHNAFSTVSFILDLVHRCSIAPHEMENHSPRFSGASSYSFFAAIQHRLHFFLPCQPDLRPTSLATNWWPTAPSRAAWCSNPCGRRLSPPATTSLSRRRNTPSSRSPQANGPRRSSRFWATRSPSAGQISPGSWGWPISSRFCFQTDPVICI